MQGDPEMEGNDDKLDPSSADDMAAFATQLRSAGLHAEAGEAAKLGMEAAEAAEQGLAPWELLDALSVKAPEEYDAMASVMTREEIINAFAHVAESERASAIYEEADRSRNYRRIVDLLMFTHEQIGRHQKIPHGLSDRPEPPTVSPLAKLDTQKEIDEIYRLPHHELMSPENQRRLQHLFVRLHGETPIVGAGGRYA
jgi:hypothetical protein